MFLGIWRIEICEDGCVSLRLVCDVIWWILLPHTHCMLFLLTSDVISNTNVDIY
jgi:hypothetical protein